MTEIWKKIGQWILVILSIFILIGGCQYLLNGNNGDYSEAIVEKRNLNTTVSVSGKVVPSEKAELAFEESGRVSIIHTAIGNLIRIGDPIITLENQDKKADLAEANARLQSQKAQLQQFRASLKTEQAKLAELNSGTRPEELEIAETEKGNAEKIVKDKQQIFKEQQEISRTKKEKDEKSIADAQENYDSVVDQNSIANKNMYSDIPLLVQETINSTISAVITKTGNIYRSNNPNASNSQLAEGSDYTANFRIPDGQFPLEIIANTKKKAALRYNNELQEELSKISESSTYTEKEALLIQAEKVLKTSLEFLQVTKNLLAVANNEEQSDLVSTFRSAANEAAIDITSKLNQVENQEQLIRTQRNENQNRLIAAQEKLNAAKNSLEITVITTQQDLSNAESNINTAENTLKSAAKELNLKLAGARQEQLDAQEALVEERRANLSFQQAKIEESEAEVLRKEADLEKTVLRSPIDGIISKQDTERGEIIAANTVIAGVLSEDNFEIEVNIPEINIASLEVEQTALVTLDAYGKDIKFEAIISHIDPAETLIDDVPNYEISLTFLKKDERIRSGMTANVTLISAEKENVLTVPQRAVYQDGEELYVFRKTEKNDREKVIIESSFVSTDGYRMITKGLSENDMVIIPYGNE